MTSSPSEIQGRVDRIFVGFERMTDAELMLLRTVWEQQDSSGRQEAWTMVKAAISQHRLQALLDDARDRLASWVNNYPAPMAMGDVPATLSGSGMDPGTIRKAAIPPMLDAIAATIAADWLSPADQTVLLEPLGAIVVPRTSR